MKFALAFFAALLLAFSQHSAAFIVPVCESQTYLDSNADVIAQGTLAKVSYSFDRTLINVYPVNYLKKIPAPISVVDQGPGMGLWLFVNGGDQAIAIGAPEIRKEDVGRQVKIWMKYDAEGKLGLFCGIPGFKLLAHSTPQPTLSPLPSQTPSMPYEFTVKLLPGWNLFSTPVYFDDNAQPCPSCPPGSVCETCLQTGTPVWKIKENTCDDLNIWHYNPNYGKYENARTLQDMQSSYANPSAGFWAKSKKACSITFEGNRRVQTLEGTTLQPGWNQLGAAFNSEGASALLSSCSVSSGPYYYDNPQRKWVKAASFEPGKGYFVKVTNVCQLAGTPSLTGGGEDANAGFTSVSFANLISGASTYNGKAVCVEGYYGQSFEFSALVGENPDMICTTDIPASGCAFRFKKPYVWVDDISVGSGMTAIGQKSTALQGSSVQKVKACGKFSYSAIPSFGHVGAYNYQISASPVALAECSKDADCASAGCSGQLCVPKSKAGDTITTCEYNMQWACLTETTCGCDAGKCKWNTANRYYQSCLAELRNS